MGQGGWEVGGGRRRLGEDKGTAFSFKL